MAKLRFKLGPRLERPESFQADRTIADQHYVYRLDTERLICHRTPKPPGQDKSAGYYQLILGGRAHRLSARATLKSAVVVPTLIVMLVIGLLLVVYPLLPAVTFQVQKHISGFSNETAALAAPDPAHNMLIIPKIGVNTAILEGPTLKVLNKHEGVWHQTGALASNFVIAGHRFKYLPPNATTLYNLDKLQTGDTVAIDWYGQRHLYIISETKRINQHDTSILTPTPDHRITIYTCADRQQTQRIVVIAKPAP